jgi:N-acetylglucosamine kinase
MNLLAIDAGGTHTRCALIRDTGQLLGTSAAGPANWSTLGAAAVTRAVAEAVAAVQQHGGRKSGIGGACVAIAGYYPPWHGEAAADALAPICECPLLIETDLRAAWAGATGLAPGVVVVAGTGSVAYGEDDRGNSARAGGWGPLAGDEASGPWIGAAALRAIARAIDGRGASTTLVAHLSQVAAGSTHAAGGSTGSSTRAASPEEWLRSLYRDGWGRADVALLAPFVDKAASAGDVVAASILAEAAASLGELALTVLCQLEGGVTTVSFTGGVFAAGEPILAPFRRWLAATAPSATVTPPRVNPLGGAALLARERFVGSDSRRFLDALLSEPAFQAMPG